MLRQCLTQSLGSIRLTAREQLSFEDFQDCCCSGHLRYRDTMISTRHKCLSPSFDSVRLTIPVVWRFSSWTHGNHLRCWNGTILAILNIHVTPMHPMFQINPTNRFEADAVWKKNHDCCHGSHLGYRNAVLILNIAPILLTKYWFNWLMVLEKITKMWKANDGRATDGWTTDNRPRHKLTLSCRWTNNSNLSWYE